MTHETTGLYRLEIFIPGRLNDSDEWFDTEDDARTHASEYLGEDSDSYFDYKYEYSDANPYHDPDHIRIKWTDSGWIRTWHNGERIATHRVVLTYYPDAILCPLCSEVGIQPDYRDECADCWNEQDKQGNR